MSKISFVDKNEPFDLIAINLKKKLSKVSVQDDDNDFKKSTKKVVQSQITTYLEDSLSFLSQNNYVPKLPQEIKVQYLYTTLEEKLTIGFKKLFNRPLSAVYKYPACVNFSNNTIYISNYFTENNPKDTAIKDLNEQYNDWKLSLEHSFFHELGHLFLVEKNKNKTITKTNLLLDKLKINFEEGFAEAFSLHLMCLKYPNLINTTNNFKNFDNKNILDSEKISRNYYKKYYEYFDSPKKQTEDMFNVYEFPLIYKNIPFKESNGNLITNINEIFKQAYNLSLENNKQVIVDKFKFGFKTELLEELQKITHNPKNDFNIQINSIHNIIKREGFNVKNIHSIRNSFNNLTNTSTIKPTI